MVVQLLGNWPCVAHFISERPNRQPLFCIATFWARRDSIEPNSYGDVAGWVAGCPSQPVLYQND